jgi:hypothetical protein
MVFQCLHNFSQDVVQAFSTLQIVLACATVFTAARCLIQSSLSPSSETLLLQQCWFPALLLALGGMLFLTGTAAALGTAERCCFTTQTAHLLTGATMVILPLEVALVGIYIAYPDAVHQIAESDLSGMFSRCLDLIDDNQLLACILVAAWLVLQSAALLAGLWLALCPVRRRKGPLEVTFDGVPSPHHRSQGGTPDGAALRVPLLPSAGPQSHRLDRSSGEISDGYLTPGTNVTPRPKNGGGSSSPGAALRRVVGSPVIVSTTWPDAV